MGETIQEWNQNKGRGAKIRKGKTESLITSFGPLYPPASEPRPNYGLQG